MTQEQERTLTVAGSVLTIAASVAQLAATNSSALASLMGPGTWLLAGTAGWALVRGRRKHQAAVEPAGMSAYKKIGVTLLAVLSAVISFLQWVVGIIAAFGLAGGGVALSAGNSARGAEMLANGVVNGIVWLLLGLLNLGLFKIIAWAGREPSYRPGDGG